MLPDSTKANLVQQAIAARSEASAIRESFLNEQNIVANINALNNELLSNLVFDACRSCGDLVVLCGLYSVFEFDACDNFGQIVKAA
jgi:hypothetical protein